MPDANRCDFCNELNPTWSYPAHDILMVPVDEDERIHQSVGGWAACDACAALIEAGDQEGLLVRCYAPLAEAGMSGGAALDALRELFLAFFAARTGARSAL
jgi:hypothetical protein